MSHDSRPLDRLTCGVRLHARWFSAHTPVPPVHCYRSCSAWCGVVPAGGITQSVDGSLYPGTHIFRVVSSGQRKLQRQRTRLAADTPVPDDDGDHRRRTLHAVFFRTVAPEVAIAGVDHAHLQVTLSGVLARAPQYELCATQAVLRGQAKGRFGIECVPVPSYVHDAGADTARPSLEVRDAGCRLMLPPFVVV